MFMSPVGLKSAKGPDGKNWSRVPGGCLTPRRTVGRNITWILTLKDMLTQLKIGRQEP
jgi:hypothetical protein